MTSVKPLKKTINMTKKKLPPQLSVPKIYTPTDRTPYTFTKDYFQYSEYNWWHVVHRWYMDSNRPYKAKRKEECRVLEIGSFEGSSTVWFIENLVKNYNCELHCVDRWLEINPKDDATPDGEASMVGAEGRFDSNVDIACDLHLTQEQKDQKLFVWKGDSSSQLVEITKQYGERSFDIIYIDGSHDQNQVMIDAMMSYKLLDYGGMIVFDDYTLYSGPGQNLKSCIDVFYLLNQDMLQPLYKLTKRSPSHPDYDHHVSEGDPSRDNVIYLPINQAWYRKYKHVPSGNRKMVPGYED